MTGCAGGWCASKRDKCANYSLPLHPGQENPVDRLCSPGKADAYRPIQIDYTPTTAKQKETA